MQAVLAAGELGLQRDEEEHLRQRQRDHGEVDTLTADRDIAHDDADDGGKGGTGDDADDRIGNHLGHDPAGDVAGAAEEGGVAEGEQAGIAEQQVEGAGKQDEAQQLHHEHGVHHEGCSQCQ